MPFNFRDNAIIYIYCMVDFRDKIDKFSYRKKFHTTLTCNDNISLVPDDDLLIEDLPCQLVCSIGDLLSEPTENSVGLCTGSLFDMGADQGIKIGILSINEYGFHWNLIKFLTIQFLNTILSIQLYTWADFLGGI